MVELERTFDPVRLSVLRSVLTDAEIGFFIFDQGAGALWNGAIPLRVMVADEDLEIALFAVKQAGL